MPFPLDASPLGRQIKADFLELMVKLLGDLRGEADAGDTDDSDGRPRAAAVAEAAGHFAREIGLADRVHRTGRPDLAVTNPAVAHGLLAKLATERGDHAEAATQLAVAVARCRRVADQPATRVVRQQVGGTQGDHRLGVAADPAAARHFAESLLRRAGSAGRRTRASRVSLVLGRSSTPARVAGGNESGGPSGHDRPAWHQYPPAGCQGRTAGSFLPAARSPPRSAHDPLPPARPPAGRPTDADRVHGLDRRATGVRLDQTRHADGG